jgi:hypothetical protein
MNALGTVGRNFKGDTGRLDYEITNREVGASTAFLLICDAWSDPIQGWIWTMTIA